MATKATVVVHPSGLHPLMQAKAHHLHREEGLPLDDLRDEVLNLHGKRPSKKSVWTSIQRMDEVLENPGEKLLPETMYGNCGRQKLLTDKEKFLILEFVEK